MQIEYYRDQWPRGTFPHLARWLDEQPRVTLFQGLAGSADAYLVADLFESSGRTVLVCVESAKRAETLVEECRSFLPDESVRLFPSRDAVPYNLKSPFGPTTETRLAVLAELLRGEPTVVVAPHAALLQKVPPPSLLFNSTVRLEAGAEISLDHLARWLRDIGFRRENRVEDVGTFAVRGGIVDIYPYNHDHPLRCEFFGDFLESIRAFDVFSQKSLGLLESVEIPPMREFCLSAEQIGRGAERVLAHARSAGADMNAAHTLEHQWRRAGDHEGIEWWLHWFDTPVASVLDYLPDSTVVVWDDLLDHERRFDEVRDNYTRHMERVAESIRPLVSQPADLLHATDSIIEHLSMYQLVYGETAAGNGGAARYRCDFHEQPAFSHRLDALATDLATHYEAGKHVTVLAPTVGHAERLRELLGERCPFVTVALGYLREGFVDRTGERVVYTDNQLFPHQPRPTRKRTYSAGEALASFDELVPGDYVVHVDHGIARFGGVERVKVGAGRQDCMVLHYADKAKLYVPLDDFHRVQKYVGKDAAAPPVSKLGTGTWERIKKRTRESLKEMARELVELYAKRQYLEGITFAKDTVWQKEFEDAFLYDETPDQLRAVKEVKQDMESKRPMDRLVCGDVGFGKTEVAMRAAFKAVMAGHQVAVLAPTTVLVAQHYETFRERMASFPVSIGMLSRFLKPREQREVLGEVREGKTDILIGTHRALSKDVRFKNLGLLVIDEEQRFGVRHKERLKQYRFEVDVLSMTATPIPRTLHLSLIGARDLSVITTPPRDRLPIETNVGEYHDELLKRAIEDEMERGGQVYVVDNRISRLYRLHEKIEQLVPQARAIVGHGQMDEQELARVMREFVAGRFDVLVATTIIENGLDIPNVNTILINRADMLGLSQLYQLRGRVGRSSEQAYAFLLVPSYRSINEVSLKRLRVLEQYTDLGSGFQIAMRDLEIRGAGNILGTVQHGAIAAVGFELYCRMLKEAIDEMQGRKEAAGEQTAVKVDVECDAYIPTEYVADAPTRVSLYRQLSSVRSVDDASELRTLFADRFGPLPPSVESLLSLVELKIAARALGSERVGIGRDGAFTVYVQGNEEQVRERVQRLIRAGKGRFEVFYEQPLRARATLGGATAAERIDEAAALLNAAL